MPPYAASKWAIALTFLGSAAMGRVDQDRRLGIAVIPPMCGTTSAAFAFQWVDGGGKAFAASTVAGLLDQECPIWR
ncbi:hypothetical protein GCM10010841_08780 [Deinococcus aerophilus]|uniref:Uncharacterized protein n=1 Tax=Deinococcus aerophilus TaxID=522488 RepID=A0ABQ2GMR4_9DEIO|nr:hypothetical protein GCM10010841_08780 [Deinococcus aerophilus]